MRFAVSESDAKSISTKAAALSVVSTPSTPAGNALQAEKVLLSWQPAAANGHPVTQYVVELTQLGNYNDTAIGTNLLFSSHSAHGRGDDSFVQPFVQSAFGKVGASRVISSTGQPTNIHAVSVVHADNPQQQHRLLASADSRMYPSGHKFSFTLDCLTPPGLGVSACLLGVQFARRS